MRAFPVVMPSGQKYWTVLDDDLEVVPVADHWLRNLRFGRDRAELTTKAYAGGVALYMRWCGATGRLWPDAGRDLGLFMVWLKYTPAPRDGVADSRDLPVEASGEGGGLFYRLRPVHRLREPDAEVDRAADGELVAMFTACRSARDRLIVLLLGRVGLRRGQAAGLRRSDIHLLPDSRALCCDYPGAHLHVRRRENSNGAWSKSRQAWVMPLDFLTVSAFDLYYEERHRLLGDGGSDFLLVNLFRAPLGVPVSPEAIGELFVRLAVRAGLGRRVGPHMARRAFGSNVADAGGSPDEVQALLGQRSVDSSGPYRFPDPGRVRAAVERVATPRASVCGRRTGEGRRPCRATAG